MVTDPSALTAFDLEYFLLTYKNHALRELNWARFKEGIIPTYESQMLNSAVGDFYSAEISTSKMWKFRSDNTVSIFKPRHSLENFQNLSGLTEDLVKFYDPELIYYFYNSCMLEGVSVDYVHNYVYLIGTPRHFQREMLRTEAQDLYKLIYGLQTYRPFPIYFPRLSNYCNNLIYKTFYKVVTKRGLPHGTFKNLLCTLERTSLIRFIKLDSSLNFKPKYSVLMYDLPSGIVYVNKQNFHFGDQEGSFESQTYDAPEVPRAIFEEYQHGYHNLSDSDDDSVTSEQADRDYVNMFNNVFPQMGLFTPCQCSEGGKVTFCTEHKTYMEDLINNNMKIFNRISHMSPRKIKNLIKKTRSQLFDMNMSLDIPSIRSWIDGIISDLSTKIDNFCSDIRNILTALVISITAIFAVVFTQYAGTKAALGLALLILGLYLAPEILEKVHTLLEDYVNSCNKVIAQDGDTGISQLDLITRMFSFTVFKVPTVKNLDKLMKSVSNFPRFVTGLEMISNYLGKGFELARKYFYKYILGTEVPVSDESPLLAWINRSETLYIENVKGEFTFDELNFNVVTSLYSEGIRFLQSSLYRSESSVIVKMLTVLSGLIQEFKNKGFSHSSARNPPVAIYLSGDTGCGKSTLTYPLSADVISRISNDSSIDLKRDWKRLIYTRNSEQEFWDGYDNQLVCVFDDFCQRRDNAMNPNTELFEIIRTVNFFPYPLHMAELSQKQNTFFTSKVVLCSSNIDLVDLKTESLNYPEAVKRRFDLNIKLSLKSDIVKEDLWKSDEFNPDIYEFEEFSIDGKTKGKLSYDDLVERISSLYKHRYTLVSTMEKYIENKFSKQQIKPQMMSWLFPIKKQPKMIFGTPDSGEKLPVLDYWTQVMEERCQLRSRWQKTYTRLVSKYPIIKVVGVASMLIGVVCAGLGIFYTFRSEKPKNIISLESCERVNTRPTIKCESCERVNVRPVIKCESCERVNVRPIIKCESCERTCARPSVNVEGCEETEEKILIDGRPLDTVLAESQGVLDMNASEILGKLLKKNFYAIYCGETRVGHGIFIRGNVMLYPTHFNSFFNVQLKKNPEVIVTLQAPFVNRPAWTLYVKDLIARSKSFTSIEGLPSDISMTSIIEAWCHSDITNLFVEKSSVSKVHGSSAMMPCIFTKNVNDNPFGIIRFTNAESRLKTSNVEYNNTEGVTVKIRQAWEYMLDTVNGDCGAPLIIRNPQATGKIVGIHVAGSNDGRGYSVPLYREYITRCLQQFPLEDLTNLEISKNEYISPQSAVLDLKPDGTFSLMDEEIPFPGEFEKLGNCRPVPAPRVSQIVKSLCHGEVQTPKTRPTLLTHKIQEDGTIWNPMHERMRKYGRKLTAIPHNDINVAEKAITKDLIALIHRKQIDLNNFKSVYDFETAMKGIDGDETVNSIKRKSSPGYPWVFKSKKIGKREFFGEDGEFLFDTPLCKELQKEVNQVIDLAKQGKTSLHIFTDLLKDERKPLEKSHKTRAFSGCPLEYLACCKMYFQGVISILTKLKNESHISVGTNVYSTDWDMMTRLLTSKSDGFVAGDFEGFDSSQLVPILRGVGRILNNICKLFPDWKEEDDLIRNILLQSLWHSVHANGNNLVRWSHALPSGHYLTAPFNSLYALMLFTMAFTRLSKLDGSRLGPSMLATTFLNEFGFVAYGDDHVCAVPKKYQGYFNQVTLQEVFKHYGIGYTTEDKQDIVEPIRTLDKITYLKRSFRLEEVRQRYVAPLTLDTILETPMWIHKSDDPVEATVANLEFSLRELSLHSEDVWDLYAPKLVEIVNKLGRTTVFNDYVETQEFVLNSEYSDL